MRRTIKHFQYELTIGDTELLKLAAGVMFGHESDAMISGRVSIAFAILKIFSRGPYL